jgi:GDP-L-fucose synthase
MVGCNLLEHPGIANFEILTPTKRELDLVDFPAVEDYLKQHRPELVIHAAAKVEGIQSNIRAPLQFLLQNLDMGRNVVLAARNAGIERLINFGSSCMYPRNIAKPLTEEMILTGELEPTNEAYAIAKIAVTRLCQYISREQSEMQYKTLIPCNLYGRYDNFSPDKSHLVPSVIYKLELAKANNDDAVEVWGDGTARREFMYAGDMADFLVAAIEKFDGLPELINVGLGHDYSINEYYAAAAEVVGWHGRFTHDTSKPVGMQQKLVSIDKQTAWGWSPKFSLRQGLEKTYEYFMEYHSA